MTPAPTPPLWNNEQERLRMLQQMRYRLQDDGVLAQGVLSPLIEASWLRSISHGLKPHEVLHPACSPHATQDAQLLRTCAEPELEFLGRQYAHQGVLVLADARAQVLRVCGTLDASDPSCVGQVREGFDWSEPLRGTNALGTSVIHQQPVWINSGEHFLDGLAHLSCAAVPIRNARGALAGVLDLTREGPLQNPHDSISMLMLSASQIEGRLLCASSRDCLVVALHSRLAYLESAWRGLLAIDGQGRIKAANGQACSLLNRPVQQLLEMDCELLLGVPLETLLAQAGQTLAHAQPDAAATTLYLRSVQWPGSTARAPAHAAPARAATLSVRRPSRPQAPAAWDSLMETVDGDLRRQLESALKALDAGVPVMLHGETGTGKEVAARALHARSQRAQQPFVAINCAAIPEGLIESELFGYREGAFTGARKGGSTGRLAQAHRGVLFLDEIGDMPLPLQARLLRVLQERRIAPLGGGEEVELDVLLVCASHRDLEALMARQQFRPDLFYRIAGFEVGLPALRHRADFAQLARQIAARLAGTDVDLDDALMRLLERHDWPGNIRQLEMALRTALALRGTDPGPLAPEHLGARLHAQLARAADAAEAAETCAPPGRLHALQAHAIAQALREHDGNATAAARSLGISRATFYRKLRQYGH